MKKVISIIAIVLATVIGAIVCGFAVVMPFDSDLVYYAQAVLFVGSLLLFVPQVLIWRNREGGAFVVAAVIIALALILAL